MAAARNHPGLKIAAVLGAAVLLGAPLSSAGSLALSKYSSSSRSKFSWPLMIGLSAPFGAFFLAVAYWRRVRKRKIGELAHSLGYTFRQEPINADLELPIGSSLAEAGRAPCVSNVLEVARTDELNFTVFDYEFTTGSGRSTAIHHQTVARMQSPLVKLPSFILFPKTIFSELRKLFGQMDINFPESPEFSNKYILQGGDEVALRAIFTPALRDALTPLAHLTIEGANEVLFIFRADHFVKAPDLVSRIEEDKRILALFLEAQRSSA